MLYLLTSGGCGSVYKDETTAYNDAITALFHALDERDREAIYNLFSPSVREQDEDLKIQIETLLSVYAGPTDEIGWDGLVSVESIYNYGDYTRNARGTFPVRSGDTYYWCYLELMYVNTYDDKQVGIIQMDFYTADEYCILTYDAGKIDDSVGLTVHAEATTENEIRCIDGSPYIYSASTKPLNLDDVRSFFQTSDSYSEFIRQFGQPNAENIYRYYELPMENGESRYLQIGLENRKKSICSASIVNEFKYIETVYKTNG